MWLVVASHNGEPGMTKAAQVLRAGGSALDAVEAGIGPVESNAQDESVGLGGMPNVLARSNWTRASWTAAPGRQALWALCRGTSTLSRSLAW